LHLASGHFIRNQSRVSFPPYRQLGATLSQGTQNSELNPQTKFQRPKFKYESLEISKVLVSPCPFLSCNL